MPERVSTRLGSRFETLDRQIELKFQEVARAIRVATTRLTSPGDDTPLRLVGTQDEVAGGMHRLVDHIVEDQFARYPPMGSEFRYLVTVLRVVPELDRSAGLVDLIAGRAYLSAHLPRPVADEFEEMGRVAAAMWDSVGGAWVTFDDAAADLDDRDDDMDLLAADLPRLLAAEAVSTRTAIELTLVGRFYERLGDHAVHIASRIKWLAEGD
jgi:phosphate transport system protein